MSSASKGKQPIKEEINKGNKGNGNVNSNDKGKGKGKDDREEERYEVEEEVVLQFIPSFNKPHWYESKKKEK